MNTTHLDIESKEGCYHGVTPVLPIDRALHGKCVHLGDDSESPEAPLRGVTTDTFIKECHPKKCHPPETVLEGQIPSPKLIRILLSKSASDALTNAGESSFVIVSKAMRGTDEPETAGRREITLAPADWITARDACAVLLGEKRAAKLSQKKS